MPKNDDGGLNELPAHRAARAIAAGEVTSEALIEACLARIAAREATVHAWAHLDRAQARAEAQARDRERASGQMRGPLHGVPIGVKDVIDTADMPTGMGSPIWAGWQPRADAACVALARAAGAVILGKTVTCELAGLTPSVTQNPAAPGRTPGGSSSGSAAAVADRHVPVAFGTQTGGSVLRPAAYCGVIGYKPTYNAINRGGLKFASEALDTIGLIARDLDDVALMLDACTGHPAAPPLSPGRPPRIGLCRNVMWETSARPETRQVLEAVAASAKAAGADVVSFDLGADFERLEAGRGLINDYDRGRAHAWEWAHHRDRISPGLAAFIAHGRDAPFAEYRAVLELAARCRISLEHDMQGVDVLLTPTADGEAPPLAEGTGNPAFQALWTIMHVPTVTLPLGRGPHGYPVGVQLVGKLWQDRELLEVARWVMDKGQAPRL